MEITQSQLKKLIQSSDVLVDLNARIVDIEEVLEILIVCLRG